MHGFKIVSWNYELFANSYTLIILVENFQFWIKSLMKRIKVHISHKEQNSLSVKQGSSLVPGTFELNYSQKSIYCWPRNVEKVHSEMWNVKSRFKMLLENILIDILNKGYINETALKSCVPQRGKAMKRGVLVSISM